jgi:hypothetical protein
MYGILFYESNFHLQKTKDCEKATQQQQQLL